MWIVRLALDRPYTFVVLAPLILVLAPVVILSTPVDIFPNIDIPVIAVAWGYSGLNPEEMEGRITTFFERGVTTTVDNIEHIESTTINGRALINPRLGQDFFPNNDSGQIMFHMRASAGTRFRPGNSGACL